MKANLGQGAPEVGELPNAPPRINSLWIPTDAHEYAPTTGVKKFREAVANLYNVEYRQGKESKYTYENVCIVPGGRAGLSRVAAVVGDVYVGYQVPEYTTYSEVREQFLTRLIEIRQFYPGVVSFQETCSHSYRVRVYYVSSPHLVDVHIYSTSLKAEVWLCSSFSKFGPNCFPPRMATSSTLIR